MACESNRTVHCTIFERLMRRCSRVGRHYILMDIDDIIAYGETWESSLRHLEQVFNLASTSKSKIQGTEKLPVSPGSIKLGLVVSLEGIKSLA